MATTRYIINHDTGLYKGSLFDRLIDAYQESGVFEKGREKQSLLSFARQLQPDQSGFEDPDYTSAFVQRYLGAGVGKGKPSRLGDYFINQISPYMASRPECVTRVEFCFANALSIALGRGPLQDRSQQVLEQQQKSMAAQPVATLKFPPLSIAPPKSLRGEIFAELQRAACSDEQFQIAIENEISFRIHNLSNQQILASGKMDFGSTTKEKRAANEVMERVFARRAPTQIGAAVETVHMAAVDFRALCEQIQKSVNEEFAGDRRPVIKKWVETRINEYLIEAEAFLRSPTAEYLEYATTHRGVNSFVLSLAFNRGSCFFQTTMQKEVDQRVLRVINTVLQNYFPSLALQ